MTTERKTTHNSRFAKAGGSCFYDSEVLNSSFVHLMKFSAENPPASASVPLVYPKQNILLNLLKNQNSGHQPKNDIC